MNNVEYAQSLVDEFELDLLDAAEQELESLLLETEHSSQVHRSELLDKLSSSGGNFPVTPSSFYLDTAWKLDTHRFSDVISIRFEHMVPGANELKRALSFYLLPENSLMHGINSNKSTLTYCNDFSALEKYLFIDTHLEVNTAHLELISSKLINEALDRAKNSNIPYQYFGLYRILKLWIIVSENGLIPEELRINVPLNKMESPERKADMMNVFKGTYQTWVSFSENELAHLMEYALFWIEKAAPELAILEPHIDAVLKANLKGKITRSKVDEELEKKFRVVVEGRTVMELNRTKTSHQRAGNNWFYSWKTNWYNALDHVRNAVFIMIALISGARASELAPLSINDITNDNAEGTGNFWLRIVRYKTANDPNYNGEIEHLPLPEFVAQSAIAYSKLRNIGRKSQRHWLFRSNASTKMPNEIQQFTPQILKHVITQLSELLPIERLHVHRFRKTIAEILINQDERNIDLIRALFGHKTFKMTMQYIARNPAMVRTVAMTIEHSFTEELKEIITAIREGSYSGQTAIRISEQMAAKPDDFEGRRIPLSVFDYVSNLLAGGKPLFIKRTAVGTYCVTAEQFRQDNLPPCIKGRDFGDAIPKPDPSNCHYECRKIVVVGKARTALTDNIKFYQRILDNDAVTLPDRTRNEIIRKIKSYRFHLDNLTLGTFHTHHPDFDDTQQQRIEKQGTLISLAEV